MSKIKSALELALEKTADITADKEALLKEDFKRKGKTAAGKYLSEPKSVSLKDQISNLKKEERAWFKEGIAETLLANLTLPHYKTETESLPIITEGIKSIGPGRGAEARNLEYILNQFQELFKQFIHGMEQLEEQLAAQWEMRLRQKEEMLRQQTGQSITLSPQQDPEYVQALSDEIAKMEEQYNHVLAQGKKEIRKILG